MAERDALDVFNDPSRVFNCNETILKLCLNTTKVRGIYTSRNISEIDSCQERNTLTFLGTFNAAGDIVLPYLIFPYLRVPKTIVRSIPNGWVIGASESGWIECGNFYEFIANWFIKMLKEKNVKLPVILFVDGHTNYLTDQTTEKCKENGVILYKLLPNTTHILQPADVGCFKYLKSYWREVVTEWEKNNRRCLGEKDGARLLEKALNMIEKETIINSFKASGLCPLDPNRPDYSKILIQVRNSSVAKNRKTRQILLITLKHNF
ncbi:UNVERIFIED_CONTAM: hypothetical protein GTU68_066412 [Idotea baltica]|nr:hypothetical protein [Idotea baltica]